MEKNEKVTILIDEKKRLENHLIFIVKTYIYIYGFLFVYTGFVAKIIFSLENLETNDTTFIRISFSLLGLFLIIVVSIFGRYGTLGIAHIIKKRLQFTYEINSLLDRDNKNSLTTEHFLKIPVIYTWTTTAVIAGSIFYFLIIFNFNVNYAISSTMIVCILCLLVFPNTNIRFYYEVTNYERMLKNINKDFQKYKNKKLNLFLILARIFIYILLISFEIQQYFFHNYLEYKILIYITLFTFLILIEYLYIKKQTNRKTIFSQIASRPLKIIKNPFS
ncbi:MAG: hypothetical protein ACNI28_09110 [Arcobacter sp.]|uniref:hypothetical protein n=1 Tax=Arcobacter sp. TaxID=1872629 RepID=UPI003B0025E4